MDLFDTNTTFERQLFVKAERNRIPLYGVLELLPLCNLNCDMCYVHLSKQEMQSQGRLRSLDEWISLAKARVEILHREMGDELFEQYAKQTIYLAEHTEEGDACPGHMTCRAGQSSFVVNWQGMIRSCIVLDQPSYDAFDTTDDFMTLWNKIVRETEEIKTSMECNQCKLRHVCNTCAAAAVAECGDSEGVSKYLCEYTKETVRNLKEFY